MVAEKVEYFFIVNLKETYGDTAISLPLLLLENHLQSSWQYSPF
jgi:hypothetical protein